LAPIDEGECDHSEKTTSEKKIRRKHSEEQLD